MIFLTGEKQIQSYTVDHPQVVALGYFDGVHLGHQQILKETLEEAKKKGAEPAVLLIEPHPLKLLNGQDFKTITTFEEKIDLIQSFGEFNIFQVDFNQAFADHSPKEFVEEYIRDIFHAKSVVFGFNYSFGKKGMGKPKDMETYCTSFGIEAKEVPAFRYKGEQVSSTLIRKCIEEGNFSKAKALSGHPIVYSGKVSSGHSIGRTIGFPTANIEYQEDKIFPPFGVYGGKITLNDGTNLKGLCNYGMKPTVGNTLKPTFEIHLLDFDQYIYGQKIEVELTDLVRREQKFDSLEALTKQIQKDKETILKMLK